MMTLEPRNVEGVVRGGPEADLGVHPSLRTSNDLMD